MNNLKLRAHCSHLTDHVLEVSWQYPPGMGDLRRSKAMAWERRRDEAYLWLESLRELIEELQNTRRLLTKVLRDAERVFRRRGNGGRSGTTPHNPCHECQTLYAVAATNPVREVFVSQDTSNVDPSNRRQFLICPDSFLIISN